MRFRRGFCNWTAPYVTMMASQTAPHSTDMALRPIELALFASRLDAIGGRSPDAVAVPDGATASMTRS